MAHLKANKILVAAARAAAATRPCNLCAATVVKHLNFPPSPPPHPCSSATSIYKTGFTWFSSSSIGSSIGSSNGSSGDGDNAGGNDGGARDDALNLEVTLAVLKPDITAHPMRLAAALDTIASAGLFTLRKRTLSWSRADASSFYSEHEGRFFYGRLVGFMSSGPMTALALGGPNAIAEWRRLLGPTKVTVAKHTTPQCLRAQHGLTDTRNAGHGADSIQAARRELPHFFPNESYDQLTKELAATWQMKKR